VTGLYFFFAKIATGDDGSGVGGDVVEETEARLTDVD
jgi:hypothetical protein